MSRLFMMEGKVVVVTGAGGGAVSRWFGLNVGTSPIQWSVIARSRHAPRLDKGMCDGC